MRKATTSDTAIHATSDRKSVEDLMLEGIGRTEAVLNNTSFRIALEDDAPDPVGSIDPLPDIGEE